MTSLPPPTPLLRTLSNTSTLSSVVDNSFSFSDTERQTKQILDSYVSVSAKDYTVKLLWCFLDFLPEAGRIQLMSDINNLHSNKLMELSQYLLGNILVPRKYNHFE